MDNEVRYLYLDDIIPNRFQPRENFDEQALKELAVSIKEHGVIQPIIVRQIGEKYEIIAGERRYKASTMAGLTKIPAIVKNIDDKESSKVALIENLQRKDLTPIEEARTYQKILELDALTQEELARTMGKSQSAVSNKLRLLSLTDEVQDALLKEQISERHARSLLNVKDPAKQVELLNKVINTRMNVRELDEEIKNLVGTSGENNEDGGIRNTSSDSIQQNINPTVVDVEKIRNEAVDINAPQNILSKPQENNVSANENNRQEQNKFIPNFETQVQQPKPKEQIMGGDLLSQLPSNNQSIQLKPNNNQVQNKFIESPPPSMNISQNNQSNSSNITIPVQEIKNTVEKIRQSGNKVDLEEFDFDDFYQIVIRVDK